MAFFSASAFLALASSLGLLFSLLLLQLFFFLLERQRLGLFRRLAFGFGLLGLLLFQLAGFLGFLGLLFRLLLFSLFLLLVGFGLAGRLFGLFALGLGDTQTLLLLCQLAFDALSVFLVLLLLCSLGLACFCCWTCCICCSSISLSIMTALTICPLDSGRLGLLKSTPTSRMMPMIRCSSSDATR